MRSSRTLTLGLVLALGGCTATLGNGGPDEGRTPTDGTELALVSSTGELGTLRRGESLALESSFGDLAGNTIYRATVSSGDDLVSETDVLTNAQGGVLLASLMHDVGEGDGVNAGDVLDVELFAPDGYPAGFATVLLDAPPNLQQPGWNVEEVQPPHVFAADSAGNPTNAFAVGGSDPGEMTGPVFVSGRGFSDGVAGGDVHVYVVHDGDDWQNRPIPRAGDPAHIAGPINARVEMDGRLLPVAIFEPGVEHVGTFDIIVDTDRNGQFDWDYSRKDGADGHGKVGFTIQYSQAWLRQLTSSHILVNIAYSSHQRGDGTWRNEFDAGESVFLYLNPPVMHEYHFAVTKHIVEHADFAGYWNNPAMIDPSCGGVPFGTRTMRSLEVMSQRGCTNTSPTCFGVPELPDGGEVVFFDVVFDRDGDECYDIGEDLLDVVSVDEGGDLITAEELMALPDAQRVGFSVRVR